MSDIGQYYFVEASLAAMISDNDRELVLQLLEDVMTIAAVPNFPKPAPPAIRATLVPIMRRWIVEDGFFKAAKLAKPHEPMFEMITVPNDVNLCKAGIYDHWMAMIMFGTIGVGTGLLARQYHANPPTILKPTTAVHPGRVLFSQKMFFWKGNFYTRKDVIQMHANKLGGVHLDFKRAVDETHIDEIKNYFGFELSASNQQMLIGSDIETARANPDRRNRVYDATELVTLDTSRIFATGIEASALVFNALLQ